MQHATHALPAAFAALGLDQPILQAIAAMGFREPTDIQREMLPLVLQGRDVLGQARTGTGKTAAFGLPILQRVDPSGPLQALVMTPTRELADQVLEQFGQFIRHRPLVCVPTIGGRDLRRQVQMLSTAQVAVGTPGRVEDLIDRRALRVSELRFVVLDEVDRMLDIGFRDDIRRILSHIHHVHQTIFVSATLTDEIKRLARQYLYDPVEVNVSGDALTVGSVAQYYCSVEPWDKYRLFRLLLAQEQPRLMIVFTNTKHAARKLSRKLQDDGVPAREIHGDLHQRKRDTVMSRFREQKLSVLVATDLVSRGIDVSQITHIVNYDVPQDIASYVHRIGRTARMGAHGKAVTFVTREQGKQLTAIEMLINKELMKLDVAEFQPSPPPRDGRGGFSGHSAPRGHGTSHGAPHGAAPAPAASEPAAPKAPAPAMPRTLGGKFPPRRRR
ncbi:MAG: DEAD/DEAH box helicase [Phycisphaerae bacterium]